MSRRLALAWCWGSVCGLVVGWVYGSAVRDLAAFRALRRAEPGPGAPRPPSGHSETPEDGNGPQTGAELLADITEQAAEYARQNDVDLDEWMAERGLDPTRRCRDVDPYSWNVCSRTPGHDGPHRDGLTAWGTHGLPSQRDDEPCPQYSPGGGIPCSVTGTHTAHIFLGSCAPDAKDDADERIE